MADAAGSSNLIRWKPALSEEEAAAVFNEHWPSLASPETSSVALSPLDSYCDQNFRVTVSVGDFFFFFVNLSAC